MAGVLEDVFGSDLGSDEDLMRENLNREQQGTPKKSPITFSDSDDDDEPASTRPAKRKASDSEEDEPPRLKQEDAFSSDEEDQDRRERERERKRRLKRKKESRSKKARFDSKREDRRPHGDPDELDDVERDDAGWRKKKAVEERYSDDEEPPKPEKPKTEFEKALEANKALRRPRNKELDPAKVEAECVDFLDRMMRARDEDIKAYKAGKPALNKLKMLRDVELMCMRVTHQEQLMDNLLLAIIKAWLDPMPDGALPNVQIRTSLLDILLQMKVDSDWVERLQSSQGLGRVIHFLSRKETHEPNKRKAEQLMRKWARPVYQSQDNFHNLLDEFDKPEEGRRAPEEGIAADRRAAWDSIDKMNQERERKMKFSTKTGRDREQVLAPIPKKAALLFTRMPESQVESDPRAMRESRMNKARAKKVARTMSRLRALNKNRAARGAKPSISGER